MTLYEELTELAEACEYTKLGFCVADALPDILAALEERDRLREDLENIAKPCSVRVQSIDRMYAGWRKIAVQRVDIARAALSARNLEIREKSA